jgi:uncharacterized LabA/DUF88 family protein
MDKVSLFIDFKNIMSSEYRIDITRIPQAIESYIKETLNIPEARVIRTYVFMSTPCTDNQSKFADMMVKNNFDVISLAYMDKAVDVAITTKLIADAQHGIFDIGVIMSGNASLYPAIKEARNLGKQILVTNFSDKINSIYKEINYETGPLNVLYLDNILEHIADQIVDGKINPSIILQELNQEFLSNFGNIDIDKIDFKKYITYWTTRARYLQVYHETLTEDDQELLRKVFDKLNDLSAEYKPGYIKALNKKWQPESWEDEMRMVVKSW